MRHRCGGQHPFTRDVGHELAHIVRRRGEDQFVGRADLVELAVVPVALGEGSTTLREPAGFVGYQGDAAAPSAVPGWQEFVDSLRTLPDRMLAKLPEPMYDLVRRGLLEIGAILQFRKASEDARLLIVHELGERETELGYQEMRNLVEHAESRIKDGLNVAELLGIERPPQEPAAKKEKKPAKAKPRDAKALIRVIKPVVRSEEDTPLRQVCVALSLFLAGKLDHIALMEAIQRNVKAEAGVETEAYAESAAEIAA